MAQLLFSPEQQELGRLLALYSPAFSTPQSHQATWDVPRLGASLTSSLSTLRRHLAPLFDNPKLDKELRAMLREKFPEFCSSPSPPVEGRIGLVELVGVAMLTGQSFLLPAREARTF